MALCIVQPPARMFTPSEEPWIVEALVQLRPQPTTVHTWRQVRARVLLKEWTRAGGCVA